MSEQANGSPFPVHSQDGGDVKDEVVGQSTPTKDLSSSELVPSSELPSAHASSSLPNSQLVEDTQSNETADPVTAIDNPKPSSDDLSSNIADEAVAISSIDADAGEALGVEIEDTIEDVAKPSETLSDADPSTDARPANIAEDRDVKQASDVVDTDTGESDKAEGGQDAGTVQDKVDADPIEVVQNDTAPVSDQPSLPAVESAAISSATEIPVEDSEVPKTTSSETAEALLTSQPTDHQEPVEESAGDQAAVEQSVTIDDASHSSPPPAPIDASHPSPKAAASDKSSVEEKAADKSNPVTEVVSQEKSASDVTSKGSEVSISETAQPSPDPLAAKQIALLLKINKELIRLCVDLQAKESASDPIFREAATRLQTNLAFLASLAEPQKDSSSGDAKPAVALNHEPFPTTSHSPDSLLPKLYAHLRSVTLSSANESQSSPNSLGKRRRGPSEELSAAKFARGQTPIESQLKSTHSSPKSHSSSIDRRQSSSVAPNGMVSATFAASPLSATSSLPSQPHIANANAVMASSSRGSTPLNSEMQNRPVASPSATAVPTSTADSHVNGVRPNGIAGPTPQQLQGLVQAFGQNAVNNLNALQAHYRGGQNQASVAYMESNVPNFRTLPLQAQLQHMANVQNAAMQRQRQMSMSSASSPGVQPQQQQQQHPGGGHARPPAAQRRPSAALSPAPSLNVDQLRRSTQSPSAAPGTPANVNMSFSANMASPSAASAPSPTMFGHMQQQQQSQAQQPQQAAQMQQMMSSLPASLHNMPPHLQQQLVQHFLQQQQQQQQQQQMANNQSMAPPPGGMNPMMLAMLQQQQQQQNASTPMHMSQVGFRPSMSPQAWPNTPQQQQQQPPS